MIVIYVHDQNFLHHQHHLLRHSLPHLGHLYTMILADCVHRHKEQRGFETYFITGTDEHGINIERAAERAGRTPQEQADFVVSLLHENGCGLRSGTEHGGYDIFMRTTKRFHAEGVSNSGAKWPSRRLPKGVRQSSKGTTKVVLRALRQPRTRLKMNTRSPHNRPTASLPDT